MEEVLNSNTNKMAAEMVLLSFEEEEILLLSLLARKRRKRRWCVRPLHEDRHVGGEFSVLVKPMRASGEEMHFNYFSMSPRCFDDLLHRIRPFIKHQRTHRSPVSLQERLAVTLRLLASGRSQKCVAASYKLGATTVSRIVSEMCTAIWQALENDFMPLPKGTEWTDIAREFWRVWDFPNCLGCIGGKHVATRAPANAGSDNLKGSHSVLLLAICDANCRFTMVHIGVDGREGDGGSFQSSRFGSELMQGTLDLPQPVNLPGTNTKLPHLFLGDAAFPLHVNLMRPYPGVNLDEAQKTYNYRHSRARTTIKNTFDNLAARWRILGRPIEFYPDKAVGVVQACVALHNMLAHTNSAVSPTCRDIPPTFMDSTAASGEVLPGEWERLAAGKDDPRDPESLSTAHASPAAIVVRDDLKSFFLMPKGLDLDPGRTISSGEVT